MEEGVGRWKRRNKEHENNKISKKGRNGGQRNKEERMEVGIKQISKERRGKQNE